MVKLQNLISRIPVLPSQKQPFEVFFKVGVLKSYAIFAGTHLHWSLFLIKFQSFRPATLIRRDSYCKIF